MWECEQEGRWWCGGQVICYYCGEHACVDGVVDCCEIRRGQILRIEYSEIDDGESSCSSVRTIPPSETFFRGLSRFDGDFRALPLASWAQIYARFDEKHSLKQEGGGTNPSYGARIANARSLLHSRVDLMIQVVENFQPAGRPVRAEAVQAIMDKAKGAQG